MAHQSEKVKPLLVNEVEYTLEGRVLENKDIATLILPYYDNLDQIENKEQLYKELRQFLISSDKKATIALLTSPLLAVDFCADLNNEIAYLKLWISVKLTNPIIKTGELLQDHAALLVFTKYEDSLRHTKTRISYSYCPYCDKTTKDYGGKKHLYHEYGTIMADVWRDITIDFNVYPDEVINRLSDLFGIQDYENQRVLDLRAKYKSINSQRVYKEYEDSSTLNLLEDSLLLNGDCLERLRELPDNSIDFAFADPPYNLKKKYETWDDGIDVQKYFNWCDLWLTEMARVLKPGCTLAVLNIPQWCIRHFKHLRNVLDYQDWICWEGLSMPVRMIMPAHYSILCFTKGKPRPLPGLVRCLQSELELNSLMTLSENFCSRSSCIKKRNNNNVNDSELTSNLWWNIHRLKHNSKRVDHPCQLPPLFMYRLISLFTNEGETVLDPFNGAGTTTLTSQQMGRRYIGIELSEYYHNMAIARHEELNQGINPFRKNTSDEPKAKNSYVTRIKKQKYTISKKELQLEVKKLATKLNKIPTKEDVKTHLDYPMEFFEEYFISWGEVTAAARTTGMTEDRQ